MNPEWTEEDKILYLRIKDDIKKGLITFKTLDPITEETNGENN